MRRDWVFASMRSVALIATLLGSGAAHADPAVAEALFREGRRLLEAGEIEAACQKLAESQSQEPSSGTLLNLALCHEKENRIATAWAEYAAAARLAQVQGKTDRAEVAAHKSTELEPRLARVTVRVVVMLPDLKIVFGGQEFGVAALGTAVPVDAGSHVLTASAPGHRTLTVRVDVSDGETKAVDIPPLEIEPLAMPLAEDHRPALPQSTDHEEHDNRPRTKGAPIAAWGLLGVSVVGLGVATGFGVSSLASYGDAEKACPTHRDCSPAATSDRDRAESHAWVANVALGVGVIAAAVGAYLVFAAPKATTSQTPLTRIERTRNGR